MGGEKFGARGCSGSGTSRPPGLFSNDKSKALLFFISYALSYFTASLLYDARFAVLIIFSLLFFFF